jgi:hypothetical protein
MIGGYDETRLAGPLFAFPAFPTDPLCPLIVNVTSITYDSTDGRIPLFTNSSGASACLEPYINTINVPQDVYNNFASASRATLDETWGILTYSNGNQPSGNLSITLANGYMTKIPSAELFTELKHWNSSGGYDILPDSPLVTLVMSTGVLDEFSFGFPFLTMNYIIVDYDQAEFHLAPANRKKFPDEHLAQVVKTVCATTGPSSISSQASTQSTIGATGKAQGSPSPIPDIQQNHSVAITGGVVGSILGFAVVALLGLFSLTRYHKHIKKRKAALEAKLKVETMEHQQPAMTENDILSSSPEISHAPGLRHAKTC